MSRRPPAGADRSEQNRATLKQLVKLESNKSCGDCKRNKHPRWASWNIGVFICIRCSGIHRGMGTHISKVKSVDLDTWTEEQMQSMLKWGNARANKYWEHKLAEGHVPNEAKIENFIRTKYDSRRWAMDGPVPDPSTLDDGGAEDDNLPLNVVQEKVKQREASGGMRSGGASGAISGPPRARQPEVDLFGDMNEPAAQPARPSTTEPTMNRPGQPRALPQHAPAKQSKPGESLLGLDFFGGAPSAAPARPSSTGPGTPGTGRSDLKQSILSLYASKPAAPPPQPAANAFGGMQSPTSPAGTQSNAQALSGMDDAFGSLSFSSSATQQPKSTPFSNFSVPSGHTKQPSIQKSPLSGGSFFDKKPAPPPKSNPPQTFGSHQSSNSFGNDFGDFSSASPTISAKSPAAASSSMGDLFDMSAPAPPKPAPITSAGFSSAKTPTSNYSSSAFNLSQPADTPAAAPKPAPAASNFSAMNSMDAWGSSDAWATPDPPAAAPTKASSPPQPTMSSPSTFKSTPAPPAITSAFDSGWGDPEPTPAKPATTPGASGFSVQQDEEFGGWSHASPIATNPPPAKQSGGMGGGSDDLFGNVWG